MGGDLIALVVALGLGAVVVVIGLRRNLSPTTRNGLPEFGGGAGPGSEAVGLYEGEERPRRISPRQQRWMASFYLVGALTYGVLAILSADDRLIRVGMAVVFALGAGLALRRSLRSQ